jgi:cell pole-organizing protein PopZ
MSAAPEAPKQGGADPAMDDILASIRRILNEDDGAAPGNPPGEGAGRQDGAEGEPLQLTESMMVQPPPVAAAPAIAEPVAEPGGLDAPSPQSPPAAALVAPAVAAATTAAVGKLLRTVAQERASTIHRGGPTIEDVVREEMRPLLKDWLDQHLPPLVERLVRAEIERVVGRAL